MWSLYFKFKKTQATVQCVNFNYPWTKKTQSHTKSYTYYTNLVVYALSIGPTLFLSALFLSAYILKIVEWHYVILKISQFMEEKKGITF